MITYGINAAWLHKPNATGVEKYVRQLFLAMLKEPLRQDECVVMYGQGSKPAWLVLPAGWSWKSLPFSLPGGWNHLRLSLELLLHPPTVFFTPAHEIPLFFRRRTKMVSTIHDVVFYSVPESYPPFQCKRQLWGAKRAVKYADRLVAVSQATKDELVRFFHATPEKITVSPLATTDDLTATPGATERLHLTKKKFFLFIGRLERKKNIVRLVRAFATLKRKLGTGHPVELVLAGLPGYGFEEIQQEIATSGCAESIRLPGYIDDGTRGALLENARALVFPSLGEGFGLPVLEAMSKGTAVIASDLPVLREVGGETALYVPVTDVQKLAQMMERVLVDDALVSQLSAKGLERVKHFSWDVTAQKTWEAIRSV